jgi:hypothetical protein
MSIFQVIPEPTHLKAGIFGFAGSGKTTTSALIAIGLWKLRNSATGYNKPVLFIDSETGSSYVKVLFDEAGVPIMGIKTRAFVTLMAGLREAVSGDHILLIDSVTHFWQEITKAYLQKNNKTRLSLRDFIPLKEEWSVFPTLYLNSPIHIIMAGRAGYEWGEETDDEGENKLVKTGTKMKVEGDFGYEPTLSIEMELVRTHKGKAGSSYIHKAWVVKDKFQKSGLEGRDFDNPTFETFLPHIRLLNLGGTAPMIDTDTSSSAMLTDHRSVANKLKQRDITTENLWALMPLKFNSRTDVGKKLGAAFLQDTFATLSQTEINGLSNEVLTAGLNKLRAVPDLIEETKK